MRFKVDVTSSNVLRMRSLQTKLNAGLSEQQQEDLFENESSFHEVKILLDKLTRPPGHFGCHEITSFGSPGMFKLRKHGGKTF